jgi:hypothetical protein
VWEGSIFQIDAEFQQKATQLVHDRLIAIKDSQVLHWCVNNQAMEYFDFLLSLAPSNERESALYISTCLGARHSCVLHRPCLLICRPGSIQRASILRKSSVFVITWWHSVLIEIWSTVRLEIIACLLSHRNTRYSRP